MTELRLVRLDAAHDRATFDCGTPALNRYLREQAGQDVRRNAARCFVALAGEAQIAGYYTLSAAMLRRTQLPETKAKKLPRYADVPAARIGRLAVDAGFQGQGLGGALLADACQRALRSDIAACALVVDAKDDAAVRFYRHHGFEDIPDTQRSMFLVLPR